MSRTRTSPSISNLARSRSASSGSRSSRRAGVTNASSPRKAASSSRFKERAAYDTSVETSVYLAPKETGRGIGRPLYEALFAALADEDVHRAYGAIATPNETSIALHAKLGFLRAAVYHEVGRK